MSGYTRVLPVQRRWFHSPPTALNLATASFLPTGAAGSDVTDGMLFLSGTDQYDVVELDVDGGAEKALDFSYNLARLGFGDARPSIDTPTNYGLPSLRSAGFSVARVDRATRLVTTFNTAKSNNTAITTSAAVTLHAEDVTRGYRIDVWDSMTGQWHSLCLRDGTYSFLNGPLTRTFSDEGFTTVATSQSADGTTTDLRLPESLFRWAGWSLCASRARQDHRPRADVRSAAAVQSGHHRHAVADIVHRAEGHAAAAAIRRAIPVPGPRRGRWPETASPGRDFWTAFTASRHSQFRICDTNRSPLRPWCCARALDPVATPGESGDRIVIRSNFNTHIAGGLRDGTSRRPRPARPWPKRTACSTPPAGVPDKTLYTMLVNHDGYFAMDPAHPDQPVPFPGPQLTIPYLPDPFAPGAAFATLPGTRPRIRYFRCRSPERGPTPRRSARARRRQWTTRIHREPPPSACCAFSLGKAELVTVAMSCFLTDDPTTTPPNMLSTMKIWSLIEAANPANLADLRTLALNGGHWMLTPPRLLTLVHAVQQPLLEPQFQNLQAGKVLGQTFATLTDEFPIDGKSTIKVDIQSTWQDPVDDLSDNPQPVVLNGAVRAFEIPIEVPTDPVCVIDRCSRREPARVSRHQTPQCYLHGGGDHPVQGILPRRIDGKPGQHHADIATGDHFGAEFGASRGAQAALRSAGLRMGERLPRASWQISKRRKGGALRVYLDRPWFSSGEGELLAAILYGMRTAPPGTVPGLPDSRSRSKAM